MGGNRGKQNATSRHEWDERNIGFLIYHCFCRREDNQLAQAVLQLSNKGRRVNDKHDHHSLETEWKKRSTTKGGVNIQTPMGGVFYQKRNE